MVKEWILTSPPDQLLCRNVANGENLISVFTNERLRFTNVKICVEAGCCNLISVFTNERLRFTNVIFALRLAVAVYISDVNLETKSR